MSNDALLRVVDCVCYCNACEDDGIEGRYYLEYACSNCSSHFIVKLRLGDHAPLMTKCPHCGVDGWNTRLALVPDPGAS